MSKQTKKSQLINWDFSKIHDWIVFAFFLFLPTQFGKHFFLSFSYLSGVRVDYLAPTAYLTDLLVVILVILNWRSLLTFFRNQKVLSFLVLILMGGFFAPSKEIFFYYFVKLLEIFSVWNIMNVRKVSSLSLFLPLIIGAGFEFILATAQFIEKQSLQGIFYFFGERAINLTQPDIAKASLQGIEFLRPYGTFSHPNSMSGFYLLIYAFLLTCPDGKRKWLRFAGMFFCLALIILSFSKVALIALFIVQIVYLWKDKKARDCLPCLISRLALFIVLAGIVLSAHTDPLSFTKRLLLVKNALSIIISYPLFGVGLGNYLVVQETLKPSLVSFPYQPVHNIFLLWIAEVGMIPILYLLFIGKKFFARIEKSQPFFLCLIVICLTGFFDHYWLTLQQNMLLAASILGVVWKKSEVKDL